MITYSLFTDKGDHDPNEDTIGMMEKDGAYCFVLADGLGGHGNGDKASQLVAGSVADIFLEEGDSPEFLRKAFCESQDQLMEEQVRLKCVESMKTTMVVLTVGETEIRWGHIGDSRLYHFKHKKLKKRTLDHSVPQMLVNARQLKESEIRHHPDRTHLLRVMGTRWEEQPFELEMSVPVKCWGRQAFLLCSDGFWELIEEREMVRLLKASKTVQQWMGGMVEIVMRNGAEVEKDNISAIAVWIER